MMSMLWGMVVYFCINCPRFLTSYNAVNMCKLREATSAEYYPIE